MHPILFHLGSVTVRSYGVLLVTGFLAGLWRAMWLCQRRQKELPPGSPRRVHPDAIFDIGIGVLFSGLVGARLLFVLLDWGSFAAHPIDALKIWQGGLSLHGALIFGIGFLTIYCWRKKLSMMAVGDIAAPTFALSYAIGRVGCLLNGCCYGRPTNMPWGIRFPSEQFPGVMTPPSHPTQLYATLFNLFWFWVLLRWEKRRHHDGDLFYGYIAMYGIYRFIDEEFRAGATSTYLIPSMHLTDTHIASLVMIVIGAAGMLWLRRHRTAYVSPSAPAEASA
ncbi:MAG: prolipoprotein diacylglyceryl transferase [Armatimonadetes bacterium]|nr:prolipoprotein diacylglyceryl transferase [Armatimonadota bacterium]MDE2205334.1 prolipoprotein diacylglyceryl transferase [Armatimonadota bacterium]